MQDLHRCRWDLSDRRNYLANHHRARALARQRLSSANHHRVDLHSATIGIISISRIGIAFAERLPMLTSTARIIFRERPGERVPEESRINLENVSHSEMTKEAGIVIPLCSLTEETAGLIDETQLALMKPTATLVNAGRGRVVDTDALTRALAEKRIRHAFLDCTAPEPLPSYHALWSMDNVSSTPHYATNTTDVRSELVADIPIRVLGQYVLGIDRDHISFGVWGGCLELRDLALRSESVAILAETFGLDIPVTAVAGYVGLLRVTVPWEALSSAPVEVHIEHLTVVARPVSGDSSGANELAARKRRLEKARLETDDAVRWAPLQGRGAALTKAW